MRSEVFSAALRATAKVAFSVAFIGGCSTAGDDAKSTESEINAANPCHDAGSPDAKPSCDEALGALDARYAKYDSELTAHFDDAGTMEEAPSPPTATADETACCRAALVKDGYMSPHRDSCCRGPFRWGQAVEGDDSRKITSACTPWGPPVPPAMNRREPLMRLDRTERTAVS
jgi:hypothetical protein